MFIHCSCLSTLCLFTRTIISCPVQINIYSSILRLLCNVIRILLVVLTPVFPIDSIVCYCYCGQPNKTLIGLLLVYIQAHVQTNLGLYLCLSLCLSVSVGFVQPVDN